MPELQFCYHCRVHHPKNQMRLHATGRGDRWRCARSIEAARQSLGERESFGKSQTESNSDRMRRQAQFAHHLRLMLAEP